MTEDKKSLPARVWAFLVDAWLNITVEPVYLAFSISTGLYMIVTAELYIEKVCKVNFALGDEICNDLQHNREEQVRVQKYVSTLKIWNRVIEAVPAVLFTLFAGPWSDTHGRKFLIFFSVFGSIICNAIFMLNAYFFYELKAEYLLFEALKDFTGGYVCFFMAVHAYVADVTHPSTRTKRMAFLAGLWPVGSNIGKALGGVIKTRLGFMYNFGFGMLLSFVALLYVVFFLKNSTDAKAKRLAEEMKSKEDTLTEKKLLEKLDMVESTQEKVILDKKQKFKQQLDHFFDLSNLKEGFRTLGKKRDHNLRVYLILLIVCFEMEMFINVGDWDNAYLYLRRKLQFTLQDFTLYTTVMGFVGITSQYIAIPVMSEVLHFRDSFIVILDIAGCFTQTLLIAFATATWYLYLGMGIAFLDYSSYAMIRCMITKHVGPDEIGKILAVAGSLQAFVPLVSSPIFGLIYRNTVEFMPQTHLLVIAGLFAVDLTLLVIIDRGLLKYDRAQKAAELANKAKEEEATTTKKTFLSPVEA